MRIGLPLAAEGETLRVVHYHRKDGISAISWETLEGELYIRMLERALNGADCVRFHRHLARPVGGTVLVIWDVSPIYLAEVVRDYLRDASRGTVHLEPLTSYAPEPSPAEGIWRFMEYVELENAVRDTIEALRPDMRNAVARLHLRPEIVKAGIRQPGHTLAL